VRLAAAVVATLAVASSAVAYWSGFGSGSASATAGTVQTLTVSPGTASVQLYPGGQADVALSVSNPNPFAVHVGSLPLDTTQGAGGFGVDASHTGCDVSALTFTGQTNGGAGWSVPPKVGSTNGSLAIDLPGSLAMSAGAASACQGASFSVYLTAGP
jgi:hypothetical protein